MDVSGRELYSPVARHSTQRLCYSVAQLQSMRGECFGLQRTTRRLIFSLGIRNQIHRCSPRRRIPVRITKRKRLSDKPEHCQESSLRSIPRAPRHVPSTTRDLSIALLNVRSLRGKIDGVLDLQREASFDAMLFTETWHDDDSICIKQLQSRGLSVVHQPRLRAQPNSISTNHGGVAVIAVPGVRLTHLPLKVECTTYEAVCVSLSFSSFSCIVFLIYRTGPVSSLFFSELADNLDHIATLALPLFVTGDLNIHLERLDDPHSRNLINLLASYGLECRVNSPTHNCGGTLDVMFTRKDFPSTPVIVSDPGISDHMLLSWTIPVAKPAVVYSDITYRPWSHIDIDTLRSSILSSPLCSPDCWPDRELDELATLFNSVLGSIVDRLAPLRTVRLRRRPSDPWYDKDCRLQKRSIRHLERRCRYLCHRLLLGDPRVLICAIETIQVWRSSLKRYHALLRSKRQTFWKDKLTSEGNSPRNLWKSINTLMGRGSSTPSTLSAQEFHDYFDRKVADVRRATENAAPPSFLTASTAYAMNTFSAVTPSSLIKEILQLPNKFSASDPLPMRFFKICSDILAPFLAFTFNLSLSTGVFPSPWKLTSVSPILKAGKKDHSSPTSFRPIAKLHFLSKLLERIVSLQLRTYLNKNRFLPDQQSAYRSFHSTETAVLKVTSDVFQELDNGKICLLSFLDFSAAFDSVDLSILSTRLSSSFGISKTVRDWILSFTSHRPQYVNFCSSKSDLSMVHYGIPQGSVLGPLLFILYVSDIPSIVQRHNLNIHMYADDVLIYGSCHASSETSLCSRISLCLDDIILWCRSNRLLLNAEKSQFLWCSSRPRLKCIPTNQIRIGDTFVSPVTSAKFLGVHLDSCLTFSSHVTKCVSACFSMLRQIRSIKHSVNSSVLQRLVSSLIIPKLDYCISTFSGISSSQMKRLQAVLNASARLLFGASRFSSVTPLLQQLQWLPVKVRIEYRLATLVFLCRQNRAPSYLSSLIIDSTTHARRSNLRSNRMRRVIQPRTRHPTLGGRSFAAAGSRVWNSLPLSVRLSDTMCDFKRRLKAHYLENCF